MIAGGNAVVFNAHPTAKKISAMTIDIMNRVISEGGGPESLLAAPELPTIETAGQLMKHPGIALLVVTGGPAVVKAAMASGKKVIAAGPGNPPVVVDETADLDKAGKGIVRGASFDNNIICTDEKEVLVVKSVANKLKERMVANGAFEIPAHKMRALEKLILIDGHVAKDYVGKNANVILNDIGITAKEDYRLILAEVEFDHPFVQTEMLMPVFPLVRCDSADEAIDLAFKAEKGCRHTASIYSRNIDAMDKMARLMNCSIFIKNAPNYAGLGFGGEGYTSFTIASPTGEGMTTVRNFTRERRCALIDYFRIV
jgi:acyl-CoA reductase-like NAD-dependent aldehyde dehydrogenase